MKAKRDSHESSTMEGSLLKYTNVMKGWQPRWFVMDPVTGMLHYYEKAEHKGQKSRGSVYLAGAWVTPCDDDDRSFVVTSTGGQSFRLKVQESKERQKWVDTLRSTAQKHCASNSQQYPAVVPRGVMSSSYGLASRAPSKVAGKDQSTSPTPERPTGPEILQNALSSPIEQVEDYLQDALGYSRAMFHKIRTLPNTSQEKKAQLTPFDKDLLLLKATSRATLRCLGECLSMLKDSAGTNELRGKVTPGSKDYSGELCRRYHSIVSRSSFCYEGPEATDKAYDASQKDGKMKQSNQQEEDEEETEEDVSAYLDTDLGGVEEHKSVILHLLSQVKLGMDLTKITLPTFILERRSLLEMFADCMAHPDLFLRIPEAQNAEKRMLLVLEWYLTSLHAGRQVEVAKKPYNPIIGETFCCSWLLPADQSTLGVPDAAGPLPSGSNAKPMLRLTYRAEQVSHHPPISAFYVECKEKRICMNASIWTKSRFMGMSVGVTLVGSVKLSLLDVGEDYIFGLPSAYCRSILSVPWVELGDKISLTSPQTSLTAVIVFHTKPFYGGKPHKVTAELKNTANGKTVCKVAGEWNGVMEFSYADGGSKEIDVNKLKQWRKRVRPLNKQSEFESRRLWQHVTNALKIGDIATATEHKWSLEEKQRDGENHRKKTQTAFCTQYFDQQGDTWVYKHLLGRNPSSTKDTAKALS